MSRFTLTITISGIVLVVGASLLVTALISRAEPSHPQASSDGQPTLTTTNTYTDPIYRFSFAYPDTFTLGSFEEDDEHGNTWHVVLVQSSDTQTGFQISVAPFDEPGPLTRERLLQELGDAILDEPKVTTVGLNVPALTFISDDPGLPRTREVWFIHEGALYQVSTYDHLESWLTGILSSWRFES